MLTLPVPVTTTSPGSTLPEILERRADRRRVRVERERRGGLAVERQRERAARRALHAHGLRLVRLHVVERRVVVRAQRGRGRVVACDQPEVVVGVEVDVTRDVAARAAVHLDLHDLLLAGHVQARGLLPLAVYELEARELEVAVPLVPDARVRPCDRGGPGRRRRRIRFAALGDAVHLDRRVEEVDPLVGREVVVDRGAVEPVLVDGVDGDVRDHVDLARRRVVQPHAPVARGLDQAPIGQLVEADRLVEVRRRGDLDLLVVGQDGRAAVGVDRIRDAGGPVERADEVLAEVGLRERRGGVAAGGVEGPPALRVLAPGVRMVEAHGAAGVGRLIGGREHVEAPAHVGAEVVEAVASVPSARAACGSRRARGRRP